MNKSILFFSVNRHQKQYFDCLLNVVKDEDTGASLHKRDLRTSLPCFSVARNDLKIIEEVAFLRARYSENKSGTKPFLIKKMLYLVTALIFLMQVKSLIKRNHFDIILLWNDMKWHQYIIKTIAARNGIKTAFFENGTLPNTVTFDPKGVNFNNSVPREKEFYLKATKEVLPEKENLSKPLNLKTDDEGYVFIPFQVDYDTQIISHSPWINNMGKFYSVLEDLLTKLPERINIFIKEHPASSRCYKHFHHKNSRILFKNEESTDDLVNNSKFVITINSTVGLESILKNKPVITLGNAFYAIDGLCHHCKDKKSFLAQPFKMFYPNERLLKSFVQYLSKEYYVVGNWRKPDQTHLNAIQCKLYELI